MQKPLNIGKEKALQKIMQFCAYQERSHGEVKEKLYSFGLYQQEVEELMAKMIEEDFLNEERFARAFAGGRFRMKGWGRVKIKYELKKKGVSDYCIRKALQQLDEEDYEGKLKSHYEAKLKQLKAEKNIFVRKAKIRSYLLQKGFENELVMELLKN